MIFQYNNCIYFITFVVDRINFWLMNKLIYTVGHSNHSIDEFRNLIQLPGVNCVVDVRSVPASKYNPQFNENNLKRYLKQYNIVYLHFGEEFGARRYDCLNDDGCVDFERAVKTDAFKNGVKRLVNGLEKGFKVALMCSEAHPIECHRFALISRFFYEQGFDVKHIMKDQTIIDNVVVQKKMVEEYLNEKKIRDINDIFAKLENYDVHQQIIDAYRVKNKEIAFHVEMEEII